MRPTTSHANTDNDQVRRGRGRPRTGRRRLKAAGGGDRKLSVSHTLNYATYRKLFNEANRRARHLKRSVSMSEIVEECIASGLN